MAILSDKLLDYIEYKKFLSKEAHLNFKQSFARTQLAARRLGKILGGFSDPSFKKMFLRVLTEGNWDKAQAYAKRHFSPEGIFLKLSASFLKTIYPLYFIFHLSQPNSNEKESKRRWRTEKALGGVSYWP